MQKVDNTIPSFEFDVMKEHFFDNNKFQMHTSIVGEAFALSRKFGIDVDGIIGIDIYKNDHENDYAVKEPNQIKHVENLGTWNPEKDNIYYAPDVQEKQDKLSSELGLSNKFKKASISKLFRP